MKMYAALAFFSVAYVAGAAGTIQKTAQLTSAVGAVAGAAITVGPLPSTNAVSSDSQVVTTATSSRTTPFGPTFTQGITTQQTTGTQPGFSDGGYYNRYYPGGYPAYGGAYQSDLRWDYPGFNGGLYPGVFGVTRHGFLRPFFPGHHGLSGGAYLRFLSGVYPGPFEGAYGSLYGSWQLPSPYTVPRTGSYPAQGPAHFPGGSATTNIETNAVSQSQVVASRVGGPAVPLGQQQNILPVLPRGIHQPRRAE